MIGEASAAHSRPDIPLGGDPRDVEIVNTGPADILQVASLLREIVRAVENVVREL